MFTKHVVMFAVATLMVAENVAAQATADAGAVVADCSSYPCTGGPVCAEGAPCSMSSADGAPYTLTVAFAANERYYVPLVGILNKIRSMSGGKTYRLIVHDLGLSPESSAELKCLIPHLLDEVRQFPYESFPIHAKKLGCYAFKPLLLANLRREFPHQGMVWLDSGVLLDLAHGGNDSNFLEAALAAAKEQGGVLSDLTAKSLTDLTHPKMFEYFEKKWGWSQERFTSLDPVVTNCNGAFSAWSEEGEIGQQAMDRWEECSMDKDCICPEGSSRANHRQDQAGLTLTLATLGLRCTGFWVHAHGMKPNSINTPAIVASYENGKACGKPAPAGRALRGVNSVEGYEQKGWGGDLEAPDVGEGAFWGTNASAWSIL